MNTLVFENKDVELMFFRVTKVFYDKRYFKDKNNLKSSVSIKDIGDVALNKMIHEFELKMFAKLPYLITEEDIKNFRHSQHGEDITKFKPTNVVDLLEKAENTPALKRLLDKISAYVTIKNYECIVTNDDLMVF